MNGSSTSPRATSACFEGRPAVESSAQHSDDATRMAAGYPDCPAPDPAPHGATRFAVPPGAVDTHAHVIGLPPRYPFVETRSYTPPEATAQAYLHMLDATGMTFGVLVQVSV